MKKGDEEKMKEIEKRFQEGYLFRSDMQYLIQRVRELEELGYSTKENKIKNKIKGDGI